jgi:hypothetical protein
VIRIVARILPLSARLSSILESKWRFIFCLCTHLGDSLSDRAAAAMTDAPDSRRIRPVSRVAMESFKELSITSNSVTSNRSLTFHFHGFEKYRRFSSDCASIITL